MRRRLIPLLTCLALGFIVALIALTGSAAQADTAAPPAPLAAPPCPGNQPLGCVGTNGRITGLFFRDENRNRRYDMGELPLGGVTIELFRDGQLLATTVSRIDGSWDFFDLTTPRDYLVRFTFPPDYSTGFGGNSYSVYGSSFQFCCTVNLGFLAVLPSLNTAEPTRTPTATATATPVPPTASPTATPVPPTATATNTAVPPTATPTATAIPPSATPAPTDTALPSVTPTATEAPPTATASATVTATATATAVPPTATASATATVTSTPTQGPCSFVSTSKLYERLPDGREVLRTVVGEEFTMNASIRQNGQTIFNEPSLDFNADGTRGLNLPDLRTVRVNGVAILGGDASIKVNVKPGYRFLRAECQDSQGSSCRTPLSGGASLSNEVITAYTCNVVNEYRFFVSR